MAGRKTSRDEPWKREIRSLSERLESQKAARLDAEGELNAVREDWNDAIGELRKAKEERDLARERAAGAEQRLKDIEQEAAEVKGSLNAAAERNAKAVARITALEAQLAAQAGARADAVRDIVNLQARCEALERQGPALAGQCQSAPEESGRIVRMAGHEFLRDLDSPRGLCAAPSAGEYAPAPTNDMEALMKAKHGDLPLFHPRPYTPDAALHALSETVRVQDRLQKLERMVRFLVERA